MKQKAKRAVEKNFLTFKVPQIASDGTKLTPLQVSEKARDILESRVKFLKEDSKFTLGNLEIPDGVVDPTVSGDMVAHIW